MHTFGHCDGLKRKSMIGDVEAFHGSMPRTDD
jgi:hypothetical protein